MLKKLESFSLLTIMVDYSVLIGKKKSRHFLKIGNSLEIIGKHRMKSVFIFLSFISHTT